MSLGNVKKGTLIVLSAGEYSDYWVRGTFIALKDFVFNEIPEIKGLLNKFEHHRECDKIMKILLSNNYIEEKDYTEINLWW